MHHALGNALVIEMEDLFAKMKIFQSGRTARADLERILIVGNRRSLLRGQDRHILVGSLVEFAAFAAHHIVYTSFLLLHCIVLDVMSQKMFPTQALRNLLWAPRACAGGFLEQPCCGWLAPRFFALARAAAKVRYATRLA